MFESKKNNIFFKLWAWLSPIGNLVIIWEGKESLIEDFTDEEVEQSFKWTIVKFKQWVPYQTEVVNAISKNGKNLIVQRAVEKCPMNWSSTTLVQSPYLFDEWDIFFMNLTAWDLYKIDEKFSNKLDIDWWIRTWLPINSIIYVNAEGEEDVLEFDPEVDSWKAILIDPLWWLKLESPSVNIWDLEEETIINEDDEFILNRPWEGNKKIDAINLLRSNKEIFVAWEEITQADIDNGNNALYQNTDWKVYKTDTSNSSKINFIWFATTPALANGNIIVDTSWIHTRTINSWDIWKDFYLWKVYWNIVNWTTITQNSWGASTYAGNTIAYSTTYQSQAQSFKFTSEIFRNIKVDIIKQWGPTWNLSAKLYKWTWTWNLIATSTNTIDWAWLSTGSYTQCQFDFDDIIVDINTTYSIVLSSDWANSTTNCWYVSYVFNNPYTNWQQYSVDSSWTFANHNNYWNVTDIKFIIQQWNWDIISNISTTPWDNLVIIWKAISTWILINNFYKWIKDIITVYSTWTTWNWDTWNIVANTDWFITVSLQATWNSSTINAQIQIDWVWKWEISANYAYWQYNSFTLPIKKWSTYRVFAFNSAWAWSRNANVYFTPLS